MSEDKALVPTADYDSPWKEIIERYFPDFVSFFFPQAYADIDWSRPYTFLDKELQQVVREVGLSLIARLSYRETVRLYGQAR